MGRISKTMITCMIIWFVGASVVIAAQTPKSEKEIPIFSGATRDAAAEAVRRDQGSSEGKIYWMSASPEEVFNFYLQKIGGNEGAMWEGDPNTLPKGGASPVKYEIDYYTAEDFTESTNEMMLHPGKWIKETLLKNRKPLKPGMWIKSAYFAWIVKNLDGSMTDFFLGIVDLGFNLPNDFYTVDYLSKKYKQNTGITVIVSVSQSEETMREESEKEMEEETVARTKALKGKPPTEKDLGIPVYPGAAFSAEASAGMSLGDDYTMYIYLSNDQPLKVVAFYEAKLKKKATKTDDMYMIPLKGELPIPEESIVIQPNTMFDGGAKTVITIQKN